MAKNYNRHFRKATFKWKSTTHLPKMMNSLSNFQIYLVLIHREVSSSQYKLISEPTG